MVDLDAAIGYVVAKGHPLERARLTYLRTGAAPTEARMAEAEAGQGPSGGWPALGGAKTPSLDATCFRLAELDDLGGLSRPVARKALTWLAGRQSGDGSWQEDEALADTAPPWAQPGDPEATLYLTANVAFWLTVADLDDRAGRPHGAPGAFDRHVALAAEYIRERLNPDGSWPSYLVAGWLGAAVLYRRDMFYDAARMQVVLTDRASGMTAAGCAWMAAALRRVNLADDDNVLVAARKRLTELQRSDGGWASDDGDTFDVHVTLTAIRACR